MKGRRNKKLDDYWLANYVSDCTLCGNTGVIDTRGTTTPAGLEVGRLNYCICPNGRGYRVRSIPLESIRIGHPRRPLEEIMAPYSDYMEKEKT